MNEKNLTEKVITYEFQNEVEELILSNLEENYFLTRHTPSLNKLYFKKNPNTQKKDV